jgi:hypothetical protein
LLLWNNCCKEIGIDSRLVKPYFLPIDKAPDWFDLTYCQLGEASWEDGPVPEVVMFLHDPYEGHRKLTAREISEIIYHELTHILLRQASEDEVRWFASTINRRRGGWQCCRTHLRAKAFEQGLGPVQESWTLFQWAKAQRKTAAPHRQNLKPEDKNKGKNINQQARAME